MNEDLETVSLRGLVQGLTKGVAGYGEKMAEHEKKLEAITKAFSPEVVTALVHGAVTALGAAMDAKLEKLLAAQREDIETDRAMVQELRELVAVLKTLPRFG